VSLWQIGLWQSGTRHPFRLATGSHRGYRCPMETVVKKFANAAEAERAERDYYHSLTGLQRMEIFFDLLAQGRADDDETAQGFPRVYRIVKRGER
jgi:hypothetical protein